MPLEIEVQNITENTTKVIESKVVEKKPACKTSASNNQNFNLYMVLFVSLLVAMNTRQDTVVIESKEIQANALTQQSLNRKNSAIKFSMITPNAKTATIQRVQEKNQEYAAMREDYQNDLISARQTAQVTMTKATTNVDLLEQDAAENSAWLKMLNTIFQVIDDMTKNR